MKTFGFISAFLFLCVAVCLIGTGCRSNGQQPMNPFASKSQTAPPPSTFSSQAAYLGQTPSVYIPQTPATVYPGTAAPMNNPVGAPLPNSTVPPTPGSAVPSGSLGVVQPSGATPYQMAAAPATASATPIEKTASAWTAAPKSEWDGQGVIPIRETQKTAFQDIESKTNTISTVSADGVQTTEVMPPEKLAVSSGQTLTKIIEE